MENFILTQSAQFFLGFLGVAIVLLATGEYFFGSSQKKISYIPELRYRSYFVQVECRMALILAVFADLALTFALLIPNMDWVLVVVLCMPIFTLFLFSSCILMALIQYIWKGLILIVKIIKAVILWIYEEP